MKLHKREMIVQRARGEFTDALLALIRKHDLTYGEIVSILGFELASQAKYMIRMERHPDDPDEPGGVA